MTEQQALNYAETIKSVIDDVIQDLRTLGISTKHSTKWLDPTNQVEITDSGIVEYKKIAVYKFLSQWTEIPYELGRFFSSELGQWVSAHSVEKPEITFQDSWYSRGGEITVVAKFRSKDATLWQLKWGNWLTRPYF